MQVTSHSLAAAPVLKFPFESLPALYAPEYSVVELGSGLRFPLFRVCYLRRPKGTPFGEYSRKSKCRVADLPVALSKLSTYCRVKAYRPASCERYIKEFIGFLNWADAETLAGRYELVLADAGLALAAIDEYNSFLKHRVQTGTLSINTAAASAGAARTILSLVHGREYADEVEVLAASEGAKTPTAAAEDEEVHVLLSALAKTFDLCAEVVRNSQSTPNRKREFTAGPEGKEQTFVFPDVLNEWVAVDLACLSFAALAIGDSGANLSQIAQLEYSDEMAQKMGSADIVTVRLKEVKFRAKGKEVPIHFTAVVRKRFTEYLSLREHLLRSFPNQDLDGFLFLRMNNPAAYRNGGPTDVANISRLLPALRDRFKACFGTSLPKVTLRQLRLHVGNKITEIAGPKVSAARLGHSLRTAIKRYNLGAQGKRNVEMTDFFRSVAESAVADARLPNEVVATEDLTTGACSARGKPKKLIASQVSIEPDCKKTEGCLFCDKYRVHADETDIRKLLSCQFVLNRIALTGGSAEGVAGIYDAILARVKTLLDELHRRSPVIYEEIATDVFSNQNLSSYWAARFSQLCLLGLVSRPNASEEDTAQC